MSRRLATALVVAVAVAAGCGESGGPHGSAHNGILWLSWTLKGAAVSDTSCSGIDHLTLEMDGPGGAISIDPIPCLRGLGWEYDGLPTGDNLVILDAIDAHGFVRLEGSAYVTVAATKPATPAPIDLQPR
jgi:hypothetical protein